MDFKAKYNRETYTDFLRNKLLPEDFVIRSEEIVLDFKTKYFKKITFLGNCPSLDLNVYEIRHSSENDARVGISREAFKLISRYQENHALILFIPDNIENFRLSLVSIDPKIDSHGAKILKEYSNPRRYSFFIGTDAKTHTPEQFLIAPGRISNFQELKYRFSVEVVNKDFYEKIAEIFSKLVGGKRKKGNRMVEYKRTMILPSTGLDNDQKCKEFAVRLIGRTVFCWFLKKKKSINNIPLINNDVLSSFEVNFTPNFYHTRVEPLFFEVLNTPISKRKPEFRRKPFDTIPFLNGGLFEPHLDDYYLGGTPNYSLKIPDEWWVEFLTILETYNFTIDENTTVDIDLSVDPEMLGRIFENLLAEINPETGETARKATGSYYTPRTIVEFMVDKSLKQYLASSTKIDEEKLNVLLDYSTENTGLNEDERKKILSVLSKIKIIDPACGSGAFPMGILQKMLLILQKIDFNAEYSILQVLNDIKDPTYREIIKRKLCDAQILNSSNFNDYTRKLSIIQKCIFGLDIQQIAIDISKLRFFLSLIVDEVINDDEPNRDIQPLPNLEFKFICADTLVPAPKNDAIETYAKQALESLEILIPRYFTAIETDKKNLIHDIKECINEIIKANEKVIKQWIEKINKNRYLVSSAKLAQMNQIHVSFVKDLSIWSTYKNLFSDEPIDFFEPKLFFPSVRNGFDIVIGNPPYGATLKKSVSYKKLYPETSVGNIDSYKYFIDRGCGLLNDRGGIYYIASDSYLEKEYFLDVRNLLITKTSLIENIKLGDNIFENVNLPTAIICAKKNPDKKLTYADVSEYPVEQKIRKIIANKQQLEFTTNFTGKTSFFINLNFTRLIDLYDQVMGVKVYQIGKGKPKQTDYEINNNTFISSKKEGIEWLPFLDEGIRRYGIEFNVKFIKYGQMLAEPRESKYFVNPKIVIREVVNPRVFAHYIKDEYVIKNTAAVIIQKDPNYNLFFLLGIINSKLFNFYVLNESPKRTNSLFPSITSNLIKNFPIPMTEDTHKEILSKLVRSLLKKYTSEKDNQIDLIVYKIYGLTYEKVKIIDPYIEKVISKSNYTHFNICQLQEQLKKEVTFEE